MRSRFVEALAQASAIGERGGSMLCVALALAAGGFPVFPCGVNKAPLVAGGFKARSGDEVQVREWWNQHPDALPAIVPGDAGLAALDLDSAGAAQAAISAGVSLADGFIVATGGTSAPFEFEGKELPAMHVYLVSDVELKVRGVVSRFKDGYVIAPGARRGSRTYHVLHGGEPAVWSGAVLTPEPEQPQEMDEARVARVRAAVDAIPNTADTDRDRYVAMAYMIKAAAGLAGREIFLDWAARWEGAVNPAEDERVWDTLPLTTIDRYAVFQHAARYDFDAARERALEAQEDFSVDPPPVSVVRGAAPLPALYVSLRDIHEALQGIPDALERQAQRAETLGNLNQFRVPYRTLEKLLEAFSAPHRLVQPKVLRPGPALRDALATAPPAALIPGYLYRDAQHVLYGAPGSYKTFVALDWALHLASGRPWLGRRVQQGGVVFFAGEGTSRLLVRVAAWCARHGMSVEDAAQLPFAIVDTLPTLGVGEDGLQDAIARVGEAVASPRLLVFDNVTRMAAQARLSTVDPGELGQLLAGVDALGRVVGASTLLIAHSPMSNEKKAAGSYPILANPDVVVQAKKDRDLYATLQVTKTRDAAPPKALTCTLEAQDARPWLQAGFEIAGLPVPTTIASDDFADGGVAGSLEGTPSFTSLVVVDGERASGSLAARTTDGDAVARAEILAALESVPEGLSKTEIRKRVPRRRSTVDSTLETLLDDGITTLTPDGSTHRYALAALVGATVQTPAMSSGAPV